MLGKFEISHQDLQSNLHTYNLLPLGAFEASPIWSWHAWKIYMATLLRRPRALIESRGQVFIVNFISENNLVKDVRRCFGCCFSERLQRFHLRCFPMPFRKPSDKSLVATWSHSKSRSLREVGIFHIGLGGFRAVMVWMVEMLRDLSQICFQNSSIQCSKILPR